MAKSDDIFDDLWDDAPQQNTASQDRTSSDRDWDFLSDGNSTPPKKHPPKKKGAGIWIVLLILAAVGIATQLFERQPDPQPSPSLPQLQLPTYPQVTYPQVTYPQVTYPQVTYPQVTYPTTTQPIQPTQPIQATQPTQPAQPTQPTQPVQTTSIPYRYLYQRLTRQEQSAFIQILSGLEAVNSSIGPVRLASEKSIEDIMLAIWYDCPEVFWYDGSYSYTYYERPGYLEVTLTPNYHWGKQQSMQNKAFVEQTLQPLIRQLSGLSDYDKVMGVHEYLIDNTAYTPSYRGTTLYETLRDKKAVCEGYARVTQYLMNQLGIPVIYVSGMAVNSAGQRDSHSWNLVQVDGQWYLLDNTWDDPYFADGTQQKLYTYFCVTTEEMNRNHFPDLNIFPNCTATAANYYVRQKRLLSTYDTATLQSWLAQSAQEGHLTFKCVNSSIYKQVLSLLKSGDIRDLSMQTPIGAYTYGSDDVFFVITLTW